MESDQTYIFYNNQFLPFDTACLPANDRGLTFGDGIFETMLSYNYKLPFFDHHWQRLLNSANILKIKLPHDYSKDYILTKIIELLKINFPPRNNSNNYKHNIWQGVKLILTRGVNPSDQRSLLPLAEVNYQANLIISSFSCSQPILQTQTLEISPYKISSTNPITKIKSLNYLDKILAKQTAINNNYSDALLINTAKNILEATTSNIFFIDHQNNIFTPPLADGLLPGITRQFVITTARTLGYQIFEQSIKATDLNRYNSSFITNAIHGLVNISKINQFNFVDNNISALIFAEFVARFYLRSSFLI